MPRALPAPDGIRSWRDIPQPVHTRVLSRGGRWRRLRASLRAAGVLLALAVLGGLGWLAAGALGRNPARVPAVARSVPLRKLELVNTAGGVLDLEWLRRTLALPAGTALAELDLEALRSRLLADRQVLSAALARRFPDALVVRLSERSPVARVRVEREGQPRDLLVASDGVVFAGRGHDPAMIAALPWLSGLNLHPDGAGFRPVPGMAAVAQLLADAQYSAMEHYRTWTTVSLARLASDREVEIETRDGLTVVFSTTRDGFVQLATFDYQLSRLNREPGSRTRIDLTLGRNVPVMVTPPGGPGSAVPAPGARPAPAAAAAGRPLISLDSFPQR